MQLNRKIISSSVPGLIAICAVHCYRFISHVISFGPVVIKHIYMVITVLYAKYVRCGGIWLIAD
jgi:hypothetical protein